MKNKLAFIITLSLAIFQLLNCSSKTSKDNDFGYPSEGVILVWYNSLISIEKTTDGQVLDDFIDENGNLDLENNIYRSKGIDSLKASIYEVELGIEKNQNKIKEIHQEYSYTCLEEGIKWLIRIRTLITKDKKNYICENIYYYNHIGDIDPYLGYFTPILIEQNIYNDDNNIDEFKIWEEIEN